MDRSQNTPEVGYLRTFVTAAQQAYPIMDATVEIESVGKDGSHHVEAIRRTGISGQTEDVALKAPAKEESRTPSSGKMPYATYDVSVYKAGYYPVTVHGITVFSTVTSVQTFSLLPLTPGAVPNGIEAGRIDRTLPEPMGPDAET